MGNQFVAVVPSGLKENNELKQLLTKLKRTLRERDQEVRWTPPELWHVTLQFLGPVSVGDTRIRDVLEKWRPPPLTLRLSGVGAFPEPEAARVLWLGVQTSQELLDAQASLAERCRAAGYPPDRKTFDPHLTLGRLRNTVSVADLVKLGGRKYFGDYPIAEVILFESVLQGNIIKYVPQMRKPI